MLEIGAANPFSTEMYRSQNYYVPCAQHLFHAIGICDNAMSTTHRFLQSAPLWLPIVSHYYFSILWIFFVLHVRVNAGYGSPQEIEFVDQMIRFMHINQCMIPGPLVPFFQALAASSSAYDWLGDILPGFPTVNEMLGHNNGHIESNWVRHIPFPAAILDQLHYWTFYTVPAATTRYANFEWYRNVFGQTQTLHPFTAMHRHSPNASASLYVTAAQQDNAHTRWLAILGPTNTSVYTRHTVNNISTSLNFFEFCGFTDGHANTRTITDIFLNIAFTMQTYASHFNASVPLSAISPTGLGAAIPRGIPISQVDIRNWLYPAAPPPVRTSSVMQPIHPIPRMFGVRFEHADPDLELVAEQYAITAHINIDFSHGNNPVQNGYVAIANLYSGSMWQMLHFRRTGIVTVHNSYGMTIASRYHQSTALRTN
jgi:hypothetical protein